MIDTCPRCSGKGTRPRTKEEDGTEADPDMHPITARTEKICERCLGAGKCLISEAEISTKVNPTAV